MRRIVSLSAALILLALPAAASAHTDFYSVTLNINPSGYHENIEGNIGVATPNCGDVVSFAAGEVKYIRYYTGHFGIGALTSLSPLHVHNPTSDFTDTNGNLRSFGHPLGGGSQDDLGIRYSITLTIPAFGVTWDVIRARNNSSSLGWQIRRNC